ncbi:60S ribosomal protein L29 [Cyphellophora attinorum]|uniref:60S ribosomal protein L29 n=1 Tax=Cyphellophora attinorum TaxID=1664694 RepID=A0A0N1HAP7_9EURO|nr:60S ribosomal protein L29 [Phialophora attinorum]KPI45170.1 60S ribosomal protein L29 [Phialophora attinorum]
MGMNNLPNSSAHPAPMTFDCANRIKKPKTFRYPSLKGTDPKFRRNHKHALHGTMKALKEVKEGKRDAA